LDDVRACLEIRAVDAADDIGPRESQDVVVAPEIPPVVAEALAAVAALIQPVLLHHGAHRAIEQHDALIEHALQALDALLPLGLVDRRDRKGCGGDPGRGRVLAGGPRPVGLRGGVAACGHVEAPSATAAADGCLLGRTPSAWQIEYVSSARLKV